MLNLYPKPFHPGPATPGRDLTAASIYHCPPTNSRRYPQRRRLRSVVVISRGHCRRRIDRTHNTPHRSGQTQVLYRTSQFFAIFYRRRRRLNDSRPTHNNEYCSVIIRHVLFIVSVRGVTSISRRFQDLKHEMRLIDNDHNGIYTQTNHYGETP